MAPSRSLWFTLGSQKSSPPDVSSSGTPSPVQQSELVALAPPPQGLRDKQGWGSPLEPISQEGALEDDITQLLGPLGKG